MHVCGIYHQEAISEYRIIIADFITQTKDYWKAQEFACAIKVLISGKWFEINIVLRNGMLVCPSFRL